jgi:transcriptional regulator with PAS, ATPase and Fis domain
MKTLDNSNSADNRLVTELEKKLERYSRVPHYVLITGERGTGKTTIARRLHEKSNRARKEFINLNCASLTRELLESELFGYEKGAFTGATAPKAGLFEISSGGTLFLDEIGEIPLELQAKLLKAVEEKRIRRVGSNIERKIDTRIVAATSQNLKKMVAQGSFRADLYDRINILTLETVPLRFQKEKIRELVLKGLEKERVAIGRKKPFEISDEAILLLENYDWLGNYREILNFATRLAVECIDDKVISDKHVNRLLCEKINKSDQPGATGSQPQFQEFSDKRVTVSFDPQADDLKDIYVKAAGSVISRVLSENDNNYRQAARKMGTTHSTLSRIMKKFKAREKSTRQFAVAA